MCKVSGGVPLSRVRGDECLSPSCTRSLRPGFSWRSHPAPGRNFTQTRSNFPKGACRQHDQQIAQRLHQIPAPIRLHVGGKGGGEWAGPHPDPASWLCSKGQRNNARKLGVGDCIWQQLSVFAPTLALLPNQRQLPLSCLSSFQLSPPPHPR